MARGAWALSYQDVDLEWVADGTIYPPNDTLENPINTTIVQQNTVDGGLVTIIPEVKYNFGQPALKWLAVNSTFVAKIVNAAKSGKKFKIETGDPVHGDLIGYFMNPLPIQKPGILGNDGATIYDLSVLFLIIGA